VVDVQNHALRGAQGRATFIESCAANGPGASGSLSATAAIHKGGQAAHGTHRFIGNAGLNSKTSTTYSGAAANVSIARINRLATSEIGQFAG
jgi:hypothetical protein